MNASEIETGHTQAAQAWRQWGTRPVHVGGTTGLIVYAGLSIAHGDVMVAVLDLQTGRLAACKAHARHELEKAGWPDYRAYDTPFKVAQPGSPYVDGAGRVHRWLGLAPLVGTADLLVFHREATRGHTWATPIAEFYRAGFTPYDGSRKWA